MILDQYSDRSFRVLNQKIKNFSNDTASLIKTARINYQDQEELPSTAFAWPEMRKFAVHTKAHAALSRVYADGENVPDYVTSNIDRALSLYNVTVDPTEKTAEYARESVDDYLVPHMRLGKISDGESVKEAARFYTRNFKKMNMETRVNAALTLSKKAAEHKVKIPNNIFKHAGLTQCNRKYLTEWLEARAEAATKTPVVKTAFNKLASSMVDKNVELPDRAGLLKLTDAIYALDKKAGLIKHYDRLLPDAVATVFNTTKLAEENVTLAGKSIPVSRLLSLSVDNYADALGEDIKGEIADESGELDQSNLLAILKTLPADMQMSLVKNLGL